MDSPIARQLFYREINQPDGSIDLAKAALYMALEESTLARIFRRSWVIGKSHGIWKFIWPRMAFTERVYAKKIYREALLKIVADLGKKT